MGTTTMSVREYANLRGISRIAPAKMIKSGKRLPDGVVSARMIGSYYVLEVSNEYIESLKAATDKTSEQ